MMNDGRPPGPFGGGPSSPFAPQTTPFGSSGGPFGQRPQPFSSPPSSAPASSQLYARPTQGIQLPDLLAFIEGWHGGRPAQDSMGKRIKFA